MMTSTDMNMHQICLGERFRNYGVNNVLQILLSSILQVM